MRKAEDIAKYLMQKGADAPQGTEEGEEKLQALLVLADMAHLSRYGEPLFEDELTDGR